jgi:predicted O-methyltransferase YrrM
MNKKANPTGDAPLPAGLCDCCEEFFQTENQRAIGRDVYEDIFASSLLFPLQRQREMAFMMQKARSFSPKVVFEIGADKAGGLYHWCKSLPTVQRVIACEIRGTPYSSLFERAFPHLDFLWLPESSYDLATVQKVAHWLGDDTIDCLFIDGDKSAFDRDFHVYVPMMNASGVVFMHDIRDRAPRRGYDAVIKLGYIHEEHIDISDSEAAVSREQQGVPCSSPHEQWLRHWQGRSAGVGVIYLSPPPPVSTPT